MTHIICTIPEYCDDLETFRALHLCSSGDGTFTTCDNDGNHDHCDDEDALSIMDGELEAHKLYHEWVLTHGKDPCDFYYVEYKDKREIEFLAKIRQASSQLELVSVTYEGKERAPEELEEQVASFFDLEGLTIADIADDYSARKVGDGWTISGKLEYMADRAQEDIARDLRAIATKSLRSHIGAA